jgi:5-methylcytosine-specific restriction protein A
MTASARPKRLPTLQIGTKHRVVNLAAHAPVIPSDQERTSGERARLRTIQPGTGHRVIDVSLTHNRNIKELKMPTRPPVHRPPGWRPPAVVKHEYELQRGSSSSRGYGRDWQKFRLAFLSAHPLCADCHTRGHTTEATELHHIVKPRVRPELRLDPGNVRGLCESCHSTRTGRGEYGHPYGVSTD